MRYQKDIAIAAKASNDDLLRRTTQRNINKLQANYEKISEKAGLIPDKSRMAVAGFRKVKTTDELKNPAKYDIINTSDGKSYMRVYGTDGKEKYRYLQTDVIQKMNNPEEIVRFFTYIKDGDTYSPITEEFGKFKLDVQKEIAEGIEWARRTFNLDRLPLKITRGTTEKGVIGVYNTLDRSIRFRPSIKTNEAFVTAVHEMTHFYNHVFRTDVEGIFNQALKNIGVKKGTKKAYNIQREVVGLLNVSNDYLTPEELVAYSLERHATGCHNILSSEISRILLERIGH